MSHGLMLEAIAPRHGRPDPIEARAKSLVASVLVATRGNGARWCPGMNEVTRILSENWTPATRWRAERLLPLVAATRLRPARGREACQPSGPITPSMPRRLFHWEAYLRLVGDQHFEGRAHFFAAAAEAMRRVLVDHSRNRARLKRGGGKNQIDLDRLTDPAAATDEDLLALDEALDRLARRYPQAAEIVKLRFFAGMTLDEAAETLGLSLRTANRHWAFARAWLAADLARE